MIEASILHGVHGPWLSLREDSHREEPRCYVCDPPSSLSGGPVAYAMRWYPGDPIPPWARQAVKA